MAKIEIPGNIILPIPRNSQEADLYRAIEDYINKLRQTLIDVVNQLP